MNHDMNNPLKKTNLFMIFMEGIMYFFSLGKNPIAEYDRQRRQRSDADNIAQDWLNIGNDLRTAYGKYKSTQGATTR